MFWTKINFEEIINFELIRKNRKLLSIEKTSVFDTGPFPKIEVGFGSRNIRIAGIQINSSKTFYKKIIWVDNKNEKHTSWLKLNFNDFKLDNIVWSEE